MVGSFAVPTLSAKEQQGSRRWRRGSAACTPGHLSSLQARVFFFLRCGGGQRVSVNKHLINSP